MSPAAWTKKFFKKTQIPSCIFLSRMLVYLRSIDRAKLNIRVWRSLVSRLTGGQEAAGSSPVTRTKREEHCQRQLAVLFSFGLCVGLNLRPLGAVRHIKSAALWPLERQLWGPLVQVLSLRFPLLIRGVPPYLF